MSTISERTRFTLGALTLIAGGIVWLTDIHFQGVANAQAIQEIKEKQDRIDAMALDIAIIKEQVSYIKKQLNE